MIEVTPDGPYLLRGPAKVTENGEIIKIVPEDEAVALCRCGDSQTKPFCDGSHKQHEWKNPTPS